MKKSILYILFALFSLSAAVSLTACKDDGVEISGANKSKTPKNVKLLEYGPTSLTICWDFIRGATSYTVQLVDGEMNPVSEALCKTTDAIDYHEFTDLATDRIYYGRVRANFPYSSTSDWVYVTANEQPAMLMASVGILELDPKLTLNAATGSTLTYEWSYTEDAATDATRLYNIELFRDEACSELHVSWLADGKLASDKGIFTALAGYPVVRFTFSGLDPETTYYARVTNASFGNIMTPVVAGTTAKAGPEASPNNPAQAGDIVLAQDFAAFIHGGDIVRSAAGYNAVSGTDYRKAWEPATGENPQADGDRPVCNWATEFHIHTGGTSAEYVESLGMTGWGSSGNTSTRPGYIKCGGGGGGIGILYTPELAALPKNTTVTVSFSASAYAEGENVYGSDIVVEAIEGAEFGSNNSVSKKGTAVASKVVDISSAVGRFETFTVTLDGLSPTSRIAFSSNPAQAGANKTRYLLDDIVVVYDGETKLEKLTVPANVKFDAEAVYSDKLTLEWDEVPGAASYTVAWWADGTEEKDATVAEGITSASYLLKELEAGTEYHAKVKACRYNNPGYDSDYSAVVSQKTDIAPVQAGDLLDPHGRMGPCGRPGVCQQQCSSLPRETLQRRRMQGSGRRLECLERLRHHGREPLPLHLLGTGPRHDLLRLRGRQDQRFLLRPARICDCRRRAAGGCHDGRLGKGGRHPPGGRLLQGDPRRRHRQFRRGLLSPELEPRDLRRSFGRQSFGVLGHPLYGQ